MSQIKFGVFGLGRGMGFVRQIPAMEGCVVTAACDFNPSTQERFRKECPDIPLYDSYEEMLSAGVDAVVIASYCPDHAPQAVQALRAGKHVLSEVTAFHTLAQGVALARAVEETGLTYMMGANTTFYPFIEEMVRLVQSGRMGEFMYAEAEYIHSMRVSTRPLFDGSTHWRVWQPGIYYCTHSLSPILKVSRDRPVSVVGMNSGMKLAREWGWPIERADVGVALVKMASGALVKVLRSNANNRTPGHYYQFYGTKGNMENDRMRPELLHVRERDSPQTEGWVSYVPKRQRLAKESEGSGHGGGDFFVLYEFIKAVREGTRAWVDVYEAADATLPGILAHRSAMAGGQPFAVPDLRDESVRKEYENDHWSPRPQQAARAE
ncbi:MAG: Gfo/Idh/MocA family oxidoreductase [Armatimonadetes bacterium]|nr:Gfo/Idh/MocA family oxidoreductase [Armatimonadota bacterium]